MPDDFDFRPSAGGQEPSRTPPAPFSSPIPPIPDIHAAPALPDMPAAPLQPPVSYPPASYAPPVYPAAPSRRSTPPIRSSLTRSRTARRPSTRRPIPIIRPSSRATRRSLMRTRLFPTGKTTAWR